VHPDPYGGLPATKGHTPMPLYENRTYQVTTGKMPNVVKLYQDIAWPVMQAKASPKTSSAISSPTPARSTN
jgi:hypothetical protein